MEVEDQQHICVKCDKIRNRLSIKETVDTSYIYGNQTEALKKYSLKLKKQDL